MNGSLQYSALARILTLNNQIHDLENQMLVMELPSHSAGVGKFGEGFSCNRIADIQEEIDQATRASLATCWLGSANDDEEYGL